MSEVLRQTSEQYANKIAALENQISDAEHNIEVWKKQLDDVKSAKDYVDANLPALPEAAPAS